MSEISKLIARRWHEKPLAEKNTDTNELYYNKNKQTKNTSQQEERMIRKAVLCRGGRDVVKRKSEERSV